jgi:predicted TIM-barrel enzyme
MQYYFESLQNVSIFKDAIMLENMHDTPYVSVEKVGPEITATMTRLCTEVSRLFASNDCRPLLGLQILAGANRQALATALASGNIILYRI